MEKQKKSILEQKPDKPEEGGNVKNVSNAFNNFDELNKFLINSWDQYFFRGYKRKPNEFKSTLGRDNGIYIKNEINMLREFSSSQEIIELNIDNFRNLFELGQHYLLPTRLLDFSINPYIALYFAIGKREELSDCPIYLSLLSKPVPIIDIDEILDLKTTLSDIEQETLGTLGHLTIGDIDSSGINKNNYTPINKLLEINFKVKKYFEQINNLNDFVFFSYKKDLFNPRKKAQEGVFAFAKNPEQVFPFDLTQELTINLSKLEKGKVLDILSSMGINYTNLFPDTEFYKRIECNCLRIRNKYKSKYKKEWIMEN